MKYLIEPWTVLEMHQNKGTIDPSPQFQRTLVWTPEKKRSLIDSIIRGYDLPKFYLQGSKNKNGFEFKVTDGKQRINAIWEFIDNKFSLPKKCIIAGVDLSNKHYKELSDEIKVKFNESILTVTIILESDEEELNELFQRLQGGVSLIPTELRHATKSSIGKEIRKLIGHDFFLKENQSYISNRRFMHQDYLDHAIALCYYNNSKPDLKAKTLMEFYIELSENIDAANEIINKVKSILDFMKKVNSSAKGIFRNKWSFVDAFYLFYQNFADLKELKPKEIAKRLFNLESERKKNMKKPEVLFDSNPDIYKYIVAFKLEGATKNSLKQRNEILTNILLKTE